MPEAPYPALILGDTGSGKELVAQTIHLNSPANSKNMATINVSTLSATPEIAASTLFGYTHGAFTGGARDGHIGVFEDENVGTIFFDEIGDLSLDLQAYLLRAIEYGEFQKVGTHKVLKHNKRIIAATHKDLMAMVRAGTFRADLYNRLNTLIVRVPSLRDRPEEILPLASAFLATANNDLGTRIAGFSNDAKAKLIAYSYPGNIRELQNIVRRAAVLHDRRKPLISAQEINFEQTTMDTDDSTQPLVWPSIESDGITLADTGTEQIPLESSHTESPIGEIKIRPISVPPKNPATTTQVTSSYSLTIHNLDALSMAATLQALFLSPLQKTGRPSLKDPDQRVTGIAAAAKLLGIDVNNLRDRLREGTSPKYKLIGMVYNNYVVPFKRENRSTEDLGFNIGSEIKKFINKHKSDEILTRLAAPASDLSGRLNHVTIEDLLSLELPTLNLRDLPAHAICSAIRQNKDSIFTTNPFLGTTFEINDEQKNYLATLLGVSRGVLIDLIESLQLPLNCNHE